MKVCIVKERNRDIVRLTRKDGTSNVIHFPKKGPFPHDLLHYLVERTLGYDNAYWGCLANGMQPDEIAVLVKTSGHASAARAAPPNSTIVELLTAERIVECFEALLWSESTDFDAFLAMLYAGCVQSRIGVPHVNRYDFDRVCSAMTSHRHQWEQLPLGGQLELQWVP